MRLLRSATHALPCLRVKRRARALTCGRSSSGQSAALAPAHATERQRSHGQHMVLSQAAQ